MPVNGKDILIGIDAGTSVIKAVAFDLSGRQIAVASLPNSYKTLSDGSVTQSLAQTWADCAATLRSLHNKIENLAARVAAVAATAQGDGTWLVDRSNQPVGDAWLWLDARSAPTVRRLVKASQERQRFEATGTGLAACQQGSQLAHMLATQPDLLQAADSVLHCKDWLYLNLTGVRATDPSEASFTFGDFRTRQYDDLVIDTLGLTAQRRLFPQIVDGSTETHPLSKEGAEATGLLAGTPVSLGFVDMVCTALGAGVHTGDSNAACTVIGSTGVHMRAVLADNVHLNDEGTGYVIALPVPGMVTQVQSNLAATLNIDWALKLGIDLLAEFGQTATHGEMVSRIEGWMARSKPGALLYHPYISEAGERGPFVNTDARASFVGLNSLHRYPDLIRAVIEGLGMAMRDCYTAMGAMPQELRLSGGAARSHALRAVLGASIGAKTRISAREEAGAAGAAMMAAVAIGIYPDMNACIAEWVTPLLGETQAPDPTLIDIYQNMYPAYAQTRTALEPVWDRMSQYQHKTPK